MRDESLKATYINLLLLASADGQVHPSERDYLKRFAKISGVTEDQERRWQWEMNSGQIQFRPIADEADAQEALGLMARMVRVDGEFDAAEQEAYINMGKALGFSQEKLGPALREYWERDPLDEYGAKAATAPSPSGPAVTLVVEDDVDDKALLERSAAGMSLGYCRFRDLSGVGITPKIVVFHAAETNDDSKKRLEVLSAKFPKAFIAFIARRDQAPQIGWLLGLGAARCFVEPLYPNELGRAITDILSC